ncbi:MAG: hypothetical protein FOGNACKC_01397 [Anaerolineae bacterium]|nr:hypothetical protein [Anaerolineae bacterium]
MPKMTAKYAAAVDAAHNARLNAAGTRNQEELYELLQSAGWFWDSTRKRWDFYPQEEAEPATKMIMVRVWCDSEITEDMADDLTAALRKYANTKGWELVERSRPYPCRPPKQLESRIYLKFLPARRNGHA